ncbi:hypothetical protein NC651_031859, partial [Populus alba x Populus x berolinensis]
VCTLFYVSIQEFALLKDFLAAGSNKVDQRSSIWKESNTTNSGCDTDDDNFENPFYDNASVINSLDDPVSQFLEIFPRSENGSAWDHAKMFLPSSRFIWHPSEGWTCVLIENFCQLEKQTKKNNAKKETRPTF